MAKIGFKKFAIFLIIINLLNLINLINTENPSETIDINLKKKLDFYNKIKNLDKNSTIEILAENDELFIKTKKEIFSSDTNPTIISEIRKDYFFHSGKKQLKIKKF